MSAQFQFPLRGALLLAILFAPLSAGDGEPTPAFRLDTFLNAIRENDPTVAAARLRWEAARERIPAAGVLPDPELGYGYFFSPVETRVGPQNQRVLFSQKIPWPEKLRLEREVEARQARVVYWRFMAVLRDRMAAGKEYYVDLAYLDEKRRILDRQIELVDQTIDTLDGAFEAGRADLSGNMLVRQRLSELEARRAGLDGERAATTAMIRRLSGRAEDRPVPPAKFFDSGELPGREALTELAAQHSERLQIKAAEIDRAEHALDLARTQDRPDFTLGVEYTEVGRNRLTSPPDSGEDAVMAIFKINLPVWRKKYDALDHSALKDLSAARESRRETEADIRQQIARSHARAESLKNQLHIYERSLIPQSEQAYEATVGAFAAGRVEASQWLEAQRGLLEAELGLTFLRAEYLKAIVEIERDAAVELIPATSNPEQPLNKNNP